MPYAMVWYVIICYDKLFKKLRIDIFSESEEEEEMETEEEEEEEIDLQSRRLQTRRSGKIINKPDRFLTGNGKHKQSSLTFPSKAGANMSGASNVDRILARKNVLA